MSGPTTQDAIGRLRAGLAAPTPAFAKMIEAGESVRARFMPLFGRENLPKLTREDFQSFLVFRNNQHWEGLHRQGPEICSDMGRLRTALDVLLDESRPIGQRLDDLQPGGRVAVPGMGRATLTAILLVMYPSQYGVWNNRSQGSMEALGLWPEFERGESFGRRYAKVNDVLLDVAREVGVDLWTLDGLWWALSTEDAGPVDPESEGAPASPETTPGLMRFGLERHLHDFLRDNWEKTQLGQDWDLHVEDGEVVGYEYPTSIGRIDLLARHKRERAWLVVELKRDQSSDDTVGQVLRYMGYITERLAEEPDRVEGLVISRGADERLRYALRIVPSVRLMVYEVDFHLNPVQ